MEHLQVQDAQLGASVSLSLSQWLSSRNEGRAQPAADVSLQQGPQVAVSGWRSVGQGCW